MGSRRQPGLAAEALTAAMILAIIGAVAIPTYLATVEVPHIASCRANMKVIASAEEAYRRTDAEGKYTTNLIDLNDHMGSIPACPLKGTYRIRISGSGKLSITCSKRQHGRFDTILAAR